MLLNKQLSKSYMAHYALSSRILLVKLHCKPLNLTLIHSLTSTSTVEDIYELYHDLVVAYNHCRNQDMQFIMSDLNNKVGKEQDPLNVTVGLHGFGDRNNRWWSTHDQVILNTWCQHNQRHLYTWKNPGDGIRNQIDYIKYAISQLCYKSNSGADCGSDHNTIVATVRVKLRKIMGTKSQPKLQRDSNSVNKCQQVSVTWLEQTKWKHDIHNSAI